MTSSLDRQKQTLAGSGTLGEARKSNFLHSTDREKRDSFTRFTAPRTEDTPPFLIHRLLCSLEAGRGRLAADRDDPIVCEKAVSLWAGQLLAPSRNMHTCRKAFILLFQPGVGLPEFPLADKDDVAIHWGEGGGSIETAAPPCGLRNQADVGLCLHTLDQRVKKVVWRFTIWPFRYP
ncbi:uncharacterized protein EI97DRAFT_212371 [Westerdykella ornata]|uniref:Uncharacterized protein n=1 Tax=Westerdykella ornata TaxID=318751 RepID=A0A6A6J834_WESOR|nr:uncharacterized protein EI97DRAFT_212371 [Westerdykella ornata]KAF2272364.1 hypothetical protein EI97DRAFT_212371 [Westerdykella ornata]